MAHQPPHPPTAFPRTAVPEGEDSHMERWIRRSVDLLVPPSLATATSSSLFSLSSTSSSSSKRTSTTLGTDENMRLQWFAVIFTTFLFLFFQLLCVYTLYSSSSLFSFIHSSAWAVAACLLSMAVELGLVGLLYASRDLSFVASSLAATTNVFVVTMTLLNGGVLTPELSVWLAYGPVLVLLFCGGRRGLYASIAALVQMLLLLLLPISASEAHSTSLLAMGPMAQTSSSLMGLASIFLLTYVGECSRADVGRRLILALAQGEESRTKLRQASETKQKFLANMSHELRTPLHGITATALELLETLPSADKAARECCQLIAECSRLMRSLIEDILDFEQIESNRLMLDRLPFDVGHEIDRAVRALAGAAAKKRIELDTSRVQQSSRPGVVHQLHIGDPLRFRQIVVNLLSNSIKFTPEGGQIRVAMATGAPDARPEEIHVEVTDTGIGIGADHLPHLFVGFSQEDNSARRRNGGTGLGLAISKSLCEAMGGRIGCRSEVGRGSTFFFTVVLPLAAESASEPATTAVSADTAAAAAAAAATTTTTTTTTMNDGSPSPTTTTTTTTTVAPLSPASQPAGSSSASSTPTNSPRTSGRSAARSAAPGTMTTSTTAGGLRPLGCSSTFIPSPLALAPSKSPVMEESLHGVRVLLVEDNLVNQKVGVRMLASLGCIVEVAANGEECLRMLDREVDVLIDDDDNNKEAEDETVESGPVARGFDAVLMDCQMPVMDGFQATALIRERERTSRGAAWWRRRRRPLPVIALTASATKEYREQCFLSGMNDWLAKPFTKANLAHMLRKWTRPQEEEENASTSSSSD